jgi:hypothetical protein
MADKRIRNDIDTDYRLVGIASSLKEYKLCHHLNQLLDCDFRKLDPLIFEPKDRTRKIEFSVFQAGDEEKTYLVFSNKNLGEYLLPEVSNFDYILQLRGKFTEGEMRFLMEGIKQFPELLMSAEIPLKKIKSRERLVYEEKKETHRLISNKRLKT